MHVHAFLGENQFQTADARNITMSQLCNNKLKKVHKQFQINVKSLNMPKPFQYAVFTFLKHNMAIVTDSGVYSRWTHNLSTITRDNVYS